MISIIYNPVSGKGKAARWRRETERLLRQAGVPYRFCQTSREGGGRAVASELSRDPEATIAVLGGDGTVHEALNGLSEGFRGRLAILPCGSGNDFAAAAGIPCRVEGAVDLLLHGTAKPTDYLECGGVKALNIIGAGIDVDVLRRCYRARFLKGSLNYFVSLLSTLRHFRFHRLSSSIHGRESRHEALIVCACNGRRFGGGIAICPDAVCDDGLMDVVLVEDVKRRQIPVELVMLMRGKILERSFTRHERTDAARFDFDEPTTIQADGELYDGVPFHVRVVPGGLNIYRP